MPDPKQTEAYLRTLNTSDRARAAAFDAVHNLDDATATKMLQQLPFSDDVRAELWDLRAGATVSGGAPAAQPANEVQAAPGSSATRRFLTNAGEMVNPITAVKGVIGAVVPEAWGGTGPLNTARNMVNAQVDQFGKAREDFEQGRYSQMVGHGMAGALPILGPVAAEAGEQIESGDVAGGLGKATGILAPFVAKNPVRAVARTAGRVLPQSARAAVVESLESGAASRVSDVMSPKVGREKVRFGNKADKVAPQLAKDLVDEGAPLTRDTFHADIGAKHVEAKAALDAATDARLSARTFETRPMIDALLERRRTLTAEAVTADRPIPEYRGQPARAAHLGSEFDTADANVDVSRANVRGYRTLDEEPGRFANEPRRVGVPVGRDVVPHHNAARVAEIDAAIRELRQLGPVTRYEPIRRLRQSYDGPAETIYNPAVTQDFLKAQGGKRGSADVAGVLRDHLAQWDPQTAAANADYSIYRAADDVMKATAETERSRPRVGRQIMGRLTGTIFGGQAAGVPGAVAGYVGGPLVDQALASGFTTKLKTARLMQSLADAIRDGSVSRANTLTSLLEREIQGAKRVATTTATRTAPIQSGRGRIVVTGLETTSPTGSQTEDTEQRLVQR